MPITPFVPPSFLSRLPAAIWSGVDGLPVLPYLPGQAIAVSKAPKWSTQVVRTVSGRERRTAYWPLPLWEFELQYEVVRHRPTQAELSALWEFFNVMKGQCLPFLFVDPADCQIPTSALLDGAGNPLTDSTGAILTDGSTTPLSVQFGTGDGVTTTFQLSRSINSWQEPVFAAFAPTILDNGVVAGANCRLRRGGDLHVRARRRPHAVVVRLLLLRMPFPSGRPQFRADRPAALGRQKPQVHEPPVMKTPIDNGAPGATVTLLNGGGPFVMADLWAITLNGGAVIRWHGAGVAGPLAFNGQTYVTGPGIDRGKISTKLGVEVATLDVDIAAGPSDLINGAPLIPFAQGRGFDGATVILYRAFLASWDAPLSVVGGIVAFSGRVTALKDLSRAKFTMTVSAWTVLLNVNMGPDIFQAGCLNTHYDANCALTPVNVPGTVSAAGTPTSFATSLTNPDHFFDKGTISFTSGANDGLSRAVQTYAGGAVTVAFPLPFAPAPGDAFNAVRGCLLTMADCTAQGNLIHFRGQPFTPPAIQGVL